MTPLLVSRIDEVDIIQTGTATLSGSNKYQDGDKIAAPKEVTIGFVETSGVNYDIGVGNAKLAHTFQFYLQDRINTDTLNHILFEKKYCVLVDKFRGSMNVFITNVTSIDSDSHVGLTEYRVSCNVQDDLPPQTINYRVQVDEIVSLVLGGLRTEIAIEIAKVESVRQVGILDKSREFLDETLNTLYTSLDEVLAELDPILFVVNEIEDISSQLAEACQKVLSYPDAIIKIINEVIGIKDTVSRQFQGIGISATLISSGIARLAALSERQLVIAEPTLRGQKLSEIDADNLSQVDSIYIGLQQGSCFIANKFNLILRVQDLTTRKFNSRDDFNRSVSDILVLVENIGLSKQQSFNWQSIIKGFANLQPYRNLELVNITNAEPLLRLVYERYGNVDNYDVLELINGRSDNDKVSGEVYFFQ